MDRLRLACLLAAAATGCGEINSFTDGPVAGIDRPDDEPPPVTVRAHVTGAPAVGSIVLAHDGGGRLVDRTVADATGVARVAAPAGGSITLVPAPVLALHGEDEPPGLTTIYDVVPGDELDIGEPPAPAPAPLGTMSAAFNPQSGVTFHDIATACDATGVSASPATLEFKTGCVGATFDALGFARGNPSRAILIPDVTFTAGGSFTLPGVWPVAPTFTLTSSNVPAGTTVTVERIQFLDGLPAHVDVVFSVPAASAGTISFPVGHVPGVMRMRIFAFRAGRSQLVEQQVDAALNHGVDLGAELLPLVSAPSINPATGVVSWFEEGAGAPDAVVLKLRWNRLDTTFRWALYAPHGELSRRLPDLPPDLAELDFGAADVLSGSNARLVDTNAHDGWDEIRATISPLVEQNIFGGRLDVAVYRESMGF
jgi:hypothetical protein